MHTMLQAPQQCKLPQGFLTAVKQEVNRRHAADKWALDDVVLTSEVTHPAKEADAIKDAPGEGVFVHGLFLDGCAWSARDNRLVDAEPKKLFHPLPVLYVTGVQARAQTLHLCKPYTPCPRSRSCSIRCPCSTSPACRRARANPTPR